MGEVHYMISEAAKRVNMETHVLRHWEDELGLSIGRTEMGQRYSTEEDIRLFNCIRELKEQGILLKELKDFIPDMIRTRAQKRDIAVETTNEETPSEIQLALQENNQILQELITQSLVEEMSHLFITQEQQEEERYKKLDCLIRQQQAYRKEYAKSAPLKQLKRLFEG